MSGGLDKQTQWTGVAAVREYVNQRATGDPQMDWVRHSGQFLPRENPRCLSLCCGAGVLERRLWDDEIAQDIMGIDADGPCILEAANQAIPRPGLSYKVRDLNSYIPPVAHYDAIYSHAAVHHLKDLEHVFYHCHEALKPDGIMILYEYVGPTRMRFPVSLLDRADQFLKALPAKYRRLENGQEKGRCLRFPESGPEDLTEAVRSAEIMEQALHRFEVLHEAELGGALAMQVLNGISQNFQDELTGDLKCWMHDLLAEDEKSWPSYHAYAVLKMRMPF